MQNLAIFTEPNPIMNRENFSPLIHEHHASLMVYARVLTGDVNRAADVVQESFITAWQNLEKFDITRDVASWLRGIVRNKWRESLRKTRREVSMDEQSLELLENTIHEWQADRAEIFDRLEDCRSALPEALAESVEKFYDESLSTDEAAEALGINGVTLRKRLERAREALRMCLSQKTK